MNIGDKEIVCTQTFIIGNDDTVDFTFSPTHPNAYPGTVTANKATVNVRVRVRGDGDLVKAEWGSEKGQEFVTITLPVGNQNRLGPGILTSPIRIGTFSGKPLAFIAAISPSPGGMGLVTLQFTLGGTYEQ